MSLSTIKQQLNKQEGVFSEGLDEGSAERCQMTTADFDEAHVLMNAWLCKQTRSVQQHTAASSFSLPLLLLALLSRCRCGSRAERRLRCCPKDPGWIMETTSGSNHSGPERCYQTETYMFKLFLLLFFFYTLLWHFFFFSFICFHHLFSNWRSFTLTAAYSSVYMSEVHVGLQWKPYCWTWVWMWLRFLKIPLILDVFWSLPSVENRRSCVQRPAFAVLPTL